MSTQTSNNRRGPRGGGRVGRGGRGGGQRSRGRGGGGGGDGQSNAPNRRSQSRGRGSGGRRSQNRNNSSGSNQQQQQGISQDDAANVRFNLGPASDLRDEDVLIAFMPYLKADHPRALSIHEEYQHTNDSQTFLKATREFLANPNSEPPTDIQAQSSPASIPSEPMGSTSPIPIETGQATPPIPMSLPPTTNASAPMQGATTPLQAASTPPMQSPIRPPIGYPHRPLTTTPVSNSNHSPLSFSMSHPMSFNSSTNSPTPLSQPPSFYLPPTLQQQNIQPPPPPTPQGSRPPLGFPSNPMHVQQQLPHHHPMQHNLHSQQQQQPFHHPPHPQQQQKQLQQQHYHQQQQQQQQQQKQLQQHQQQLQMQQQNNQSFNMMESLELQLDRLMGGDDDDLQLSAPPTPSQPAVGAIGAPTPRNSTMNGGNGANTADDRAATSFLSSLLASSPSTSTTTHIQPPQPEQRPSHQQLSSHQQKAMSPTNLMAHPSNNLVLPPPGSLVAPSPHSPVPSDHTPKPPSQSHSPLSLTPAQMSPILQSQTTPQPPKPPRKEPPQQKRLWTHIDEQPGRVTVNDMNVSNPHVVLDVRPRQELGARWMLSWKYLQQRAEELARRKFDAADSDDEHGSRLQQPRLLPKDDNPLNRLLPDLRLGLFRRGCAENGSQASIISKSVMVSGGGRPPYLDAQSQMVIGSVPFYSPRTPGHVVFRLYWEDDPIYTLAVGPTLHVRVTEDDYEGTIRFLLSNMKKKVNPTSLSSLHSLALVLETPLQPPQHQRGRHQQHQQQQSYDRAGRATWGCICEARKVLDACAGEYAKTNQRLAKLAAAVEEIKAQVEFDARSKDGDEGDEEQTSAANEMNGIDGKFDDASHDASGPEGKSDEQHEKDEERAQMLREKTRALMSGRASCERKWRDSQLAFASILKAVVSNPSMPLLLRQDMIQKMRLEYELWCPLCEEFSVPGSETQNEVAASDAFESEAPPQIAMWYEPLKSFPPMLTTEHVRICQESRASMQSKTLNFVPNTRALHDILFIKNPAAKGGATMNPKAVAVLNQLSGAMGKVFQEVFTSDVEQRVHRQREIIRTQLEILVQQCEAFPAGTKVAIFGSSANGFGTPQSDLDMCLQLPYGTTYGDDDNDPTGSLAMSKLAETMEQQSALGSATPGGIVLTDVDTSRLTARIPIIKFVCPIVTEDGNEDVIDCDLSMHNPLAVLNTTFLRTYADINPVTRVLAFIIKRWTKARDINNPARHTLSSYGYIIMLLHYLTYHQRAGNGLMAPVAGPEGRTMRQANHPMPKPLLPNLLWMDSTWPQEQQPGPYREISSRPKVMMQHPFEKTNVNGYFSRPRNQTELNALVRLFPGQDLSLAILLTSFFRYYAYEFDYKRFVVSLHSTASRGLVEREVKAELDGWRHYSAALTIEDPFETFYDVAHVLRGGYYHRIRREFAVAYSKIADVVSGNPKTAWTDANGEKKDPCGMSGDELIEWICEPVVAPGAVAAAPTPGMDVTANGTPLATAAIPIPAPVQE